MSMPGYSNFTLPQWPDDGEMPDPAANGFHPDGLLGGLDFGGLPSGNGFPNPAADVFHRNGLLGGLFGNNDDVSVPNWNGAGYSPELLFGSDAPKPATADMSGSVQAPVIVPRAIDPADSVFQLPSLSAGTSDGLLAPSAMSVSDRGISL